MGGSIGVPDVSQLPIQSDVSQYNLRNASAAFSPQPSPPPGAIGPTLTPDQSISELEQNRLQTTLNPPQYQPDFQRPQFPQPQSPQPGAHDLQPLIDQVVADSRQQNHQRGAGIKGLLTTFFHGAGESMMLHAGLETPEMRQQRNLTNVIALSRAQSEQQNAESNEGLRRSHEALYRLQSAMTDIDLGNGQTISVPVMSGLLSRISISTTMRALRIRPKT